MIPLFVVDVLVIVATGWSWRNKRRGWLSLSLVALLFMLFMTFVVVNGVWGPRSTGLGGLHG